MTVDIGKRRVQQGLSVVELAKELGITGTMMRDIEAGRRRMGILRLPALSAALGLDLRELVAKALLAGPVELDLSKVPEDYQGDIARTIAKGLKAMAEENEG